MTIPKDIPARLENKKMEELIEQLKLQIDKNPETSFEHGWNTGLKYAINQLEAAHPPLTLTVGRTAQQKGNLLMSYYFKPKTGEFIDSTADINDPDCVGLSEAQYHISRLVVRGYNREQIEIAVDILFNTIESAEQSGLMHYPQAG